MFTLIKKQEKPGNNLFDLHEKSINALKILINML